MVTGSIMDMGTPIHMGIGSQISSMTTFMLEFRYDCIDSDRVTASVWAAYRENFRLP